LVKPDAGSEARVAGWTWPFGRERVRRVEILVEGVVAGEARLMLRPDIAEAFDLPEALLSGFEASVELPSAATGGEIALSLKVHGLDGGTWTAPGWQLPIHPEEDAAPTQPAKLMDRYPLSANLDGPSREWSRQRLGYDPWHLVVLVEDAEVSAGAAIVALDLLAERWPHLELLVPEIRSDSYIANLMQRASDQAGLLDRVTVPLVPAPVIGWQVLADLTLTTSLPGGDGHDLAELIATLEAACRSAG